MHAPVFVRQAGFLRFSSCRTVKQMQMKFCETGKNDRRILLTCWPTLLCWLFLCAAIKPLDADDSLDNSETVSLKAESLSGLSVRASLLEPFIRLSWPLMQLLSDDIVVFVAAETVELDLLWQRPWRLSIWRFSSMLSSPNIASNSASCVSSRLAMENRYESVRSDTGFPFGRMRGFTVNWRLDTSKPWK